MGKQPGVACHIVDQHCLAPAGYGISGSGRYGANSNLPKTLPACGSCGQPTCENCAYESNGSRLCRECFEDEGTDEARVEVLARMYTLSGYENGRELAARELASR